ncbi:M48 family metallopeptidase [Leeia sp. TBRC 13508]|uniref:M48 family metallopeptidase n=1 Tax=Leeia speluncae TaxID=2884804 RepID=A0ABS8DA47_9NEIS|nr:M48 family metallopeptidase [Leeia speluncae]MCB6184473.1 M48 family metallopeptidase [Leeia speluncae]
MRRTASLAAHSFAGQCFGPDKAKGDDVLVELVPGSLVICLADGVRQAVPLTSVKLSRGGFNQTQWQFQWKQDGSNWMVILSDTNIQQKLLSSPPVGLEKEIEALKSGQRKSKLFSRLGWTIITLIILIPIALLGLFWWKADKIAEWGVEKISTAQEASLGNAIFEAQKTGLKLINPAPAQSALEEIGHKLTDGSSYQYQFYINNDPSINAFAIPGGVIVVNTGLIKASDSAEELAGVLAHEVQHVELRHSLKGMVKDLGLQALMQFAWGDYSGALPAQMAKDLSQLSFSRSQEEEADLRGFDLLVNKQINPKGMVSIYEKLEKDGGKPAVTLLSTHPDTKTRVLQLKERMVNTHSTTKPMAPLNIKWAVVKASLPQ